MISSDQPLSSIQSQKRHAAVRSLSLCHSLRSEALVGSAIIKYLLCERFRRRLNGSGWMKAALQTLLQTCCRLWWGGGADHSDRASASTVALLFFFFLFFLHNTAPRSAPRCSRGPLREQLLVQHYVKRKFRGIDSSGSRDGSGWGGL